MTMTMITYFDYLPTELLNIINDHLNLKDIKNVFLNVTDKDLLFEAKRYIIRKRFPFLKIIFSYQFYDKLYDEIFGVSEGNELSRGKFDDYDKFINELMTYLISNGLLIKNHGDDEIYIYILGKITHRLKTDLSDLETIFLSNNALLTFRLKEFMNIYSKKYNLLELKKIVEESLRV